MPFVNFTPMKVIVALGILFMVVWFFRALKQVVGRRLVKSWWENRPDVQRQLFVYRLRDLAFNDPFALITSLIGDGGRHFLQQSWVEAGWKAARARLEIAPADPAMDVRQFDFSDGRTIAVVCLPPAQHRNEAIFVGIVLQMHPSLQTDLLAARERVRFFFLNRYVVPDHSRTTNLCGWTVDLELRTYNIGAPENPEGFARTVEAKLGELRQ